MCLHKQNEDDNFPRNLLSGMSSTLTPQQELENVKEDIKIWLNVTKSKQRSTKLTKDDIKANEDALNYAEKNLNRGKLRFIRVLKEDFDIVNLEEANRQLDDFMSTIN